MFCGKCGSEIKENTLYCSNCGQRLSQTDLPKSKENKMKNWICVNKKKVIVAVSILAVLIIGLTIFCASPKKKIDYTDYLEVLQVCCDAVNERDKEILDDIVFKGLGNEWNEEYVYNTVDMFYEEQEEDEEYYSPLTTEIKGYKHHRSNSDIDELKDWIFEETGNIVEVEEGYELGMDNESCMEIFLIKVTGRWYVLYLDL